MGSVLYLFDFRLRGGDDALPHHNNGRVVSSSNTEKTTTGARSLPPHVRTVRYRNTKHERRSTDNYLQGEDVLAVQLQVALPSGNLVRHVQRKQNAKIDRSTINDQHEPRNERRRESCSGRMQQVTTDNQRNKKHDRDKNNGRFVVELTNWLSHH